MKVAFLIGFLISLAPLMAQEETTFYRAKYNLARNVISNSIPIVDLKIEDISSENGGCDFYGSVAKFFLERMNIKVNLSDCEHGGFRDISKVSAYTDSDILDVSINAYSRNKIFEADIYVLYLSIYGGEECFASILLLKVSQQGAEIIYPERNETNVMLDMFNVLTWSTIEDFYYRDSILTALPDSSTPFSIEMTNRDGYVSSQDINKCDPIQRAPTDTVPIALSVKFDHDSIVRTGVVESTKIDFSAAHFKHSFSPSGAFVYGTPREVLGAFMQAYDAPGARLLYQNPSHAPQLGYKEAKPRRSMEYYDGNCLKFNYSTTLPNRFGLNLVGVVFDIIKDDSYQETASIILIKSERGYKIFTDFELYLGLTEEIYFPLAFKAKSLYSLAEKRFDEIQDQMGREAYKLSRRKDENTFLYEIFIENIKKDRVPKEVIEYLLTSVRVIGPNEFW